MLRNDNFAVIVRIIPDYRKNKWSFPGVESTVREVKTMFPFGNNWFFPSLLVLRTQKVLIGSGQGFIGSG